MAHASHEALAQKLALASQEVIVGAQYRHWRDAEKTYTVLALALEEDTEEVCVVYQTSHPSRLVWTRKLSDWRAVINHTSPEMRRFTLIEK